MKVADDTDRGTLECEWVKQLGQSVFPVTGLTKSTVFLCNQTGQLKFKAKRALETLSNGSFLSFFLATVNCFLCKEVHWF